MNDIQRLAAIEEIKQLKARYFRAGDTKDLDMFRSVFTEDAVLDFSGANTDPVSGINFAPEVSRIMRGIEDIIGAYEAEFYGLTTVHHGHMPEITLTSETTATGVWAMVDYIRFIDASKGKGYDGYGHYFETYEKIDGAWRIKTLRLDRLMLNVLD